MGDPREFAEEIKRYVCRGIERKYYRFRYTKHYGGIATADCVGCNLKCFFCWSFRPRENFKTYGRFYTPEEVVKKLLYLASKYGTKKLRISGNEPTLCKKHLLKVLELIPEDYLFILETNGTLIDEDYAKDLSKFKNLHVRISLKGPTPEKFEKITGFEKIGFFYQMSAMKYLKKYGISYHPAILYELITSKEEFTILLNYLVEIDPELPSRLEFEFLQILPPIKKNIEWGIKERLLKLG